MSKPAGVRVETYRGCGIYWYSAGTWFTYAVYDSPCVPGETFRSPQDLIKAIDDKLGPVPPPPPELKYLCPYCDAKFATEPELTAHIASAHPPAPPPPEEDTLIEVYRDVEIWLSATTNIYTAQVAPGYLAAGFTLEECRATIDDILEFLYPPEDPEEGLFAQIVAEVKAWVTQNIGERLQPVYDWVDNLFVGAKGFAENLFAGASEVIAGVGAGLASLTTTVGDRWDTFTTQTLPNIWATLNSNAADLMGAIDLKGTELEASMDTKLADFTAWVADFVALSDRQGFLKDPLGFIGAAFNTLIAPWAEGIVKSFWEGFEEGLEE